MSFVFHYSANMSSVSLQHEVMWLTDLEANQPMNMHEFPSWPQFTRVFFFINIFPLSADFKALRNFFRRFLFTSFLWRSFFLSAFVVYLSLFLLFMRRYFLRFLRNAIQTCVALYMCTLERNTFAECTIFFLSTWKVNNAFYYSIIYGESRKKDLFTSLFHFFFCISRIVRMRMIPLFFPVTVNCFWSNTGCTCTIHVFIKTFFLYMSSGW